MAEIAWKLEPLSFQFQIRWLLMSNGLISVNRFAEEPTLLVSVSLIYVVMAERQLGVNSYTLFIIHFDVLK